MRLYLNTLHYLENDSRGEAMLRSVFELRLLSEIGYMPDVLACRGCGAFEPEELFFSVGDGGFYCCDCGKELENDRYMRLKLPVLRAVRHIVLSDYERLFNFRVSDEMQKKLSLFTENYLLTHIGRGFQTLDFYKSLIT